MRGEASVELVAGGLAAEAAAAGVVVAVIVDRPIIGGVEIRGVPGLDDLGVEGLDQESKKSSSVSSLATAAGTSVPSTTIPLGNLRGRGGPII